jgi:hypothetical protein
MSNRQQQHLPPSVSIIAVLIALALGALLATL